MLAADASFANALREAVADSVTGLGLGARQVDAKEVNIRSVSVGLDGKLEVVYDIAYEDALLAARVADTLN